MRQLLVIKKLFAKAFVVINAKNDMTKCAKLEEWKTGHAQPVLVTTIPNVTLKKLQNCVCCDCSNKWLHFKCSGLTVNHLEIVKNDMVM